MMETSLILSIMFNVAALVIMFAGGHCWAMSKVHEAATLELKRHIEASIQAHSKQTREQAEWRARMEAEEAARPPPGGKLILDPRTNRWVPE